MIDGYINEKILHYLSDYRLHTYREIADEVEVHRNTVIKHIRCLSMFYQITTYHGGKDKGIKLLYSKIRISSAATVFRIILTIRR